MSVLRKLAGQTAWAAALAVLFQACSKQPSVAILGKWEFRDADHKRGTVEFFADGRCTFHSGESWGPPDTLTYVAVDDSIHFLTNRPGIGSCSLSYLVVFENNDKFTLEHQVTELPTWYERVHE